LREVDKQLVITDRLQTLGGQTFAVSGSFTGKLRIALLGRHQVRNACTALLVIQQLRERGWKIADAAIERGLAAATWPGRLDIVSRQPFILVDGAHNNDGVDSLVTFLNEMKDELPTPSVLVVAAKQGKNVDELRDKIVARFAQVIVTQGNFEPMPASELAQILQQGGRQGETISDVAQAIARAKQVVVPDGMILITGSLYMVGDALQVLRPA
ncbi:MAG TPA: cyanophycin synthetase, partial [Methylophilaceae bacterium]|nr:cyanophycin synthetase [Methylophilaceae bacterium]